MATVLLGGSASYITLATGCADARRGQGIRGESQKKNVRIILSAMSEHIKQTGLHTELVKQVSTGDYAVAIVFYHWQVRY